MFLPRLYEVKLNLGGLEDGADWRIQYRHIKNANENIPSSPGKYCCQCWYCGWFYSHTHTNTQQLHAHHHVNQVCVENQFSNPPQAVTIGFVFEVIWQQYEKLNKTRAN